MSHWLLDTMVERYGLALREADRVQLCLEAGREPPALDEELVRETLAAMEIAALDLAVDRLSDDTERRTLSRQVAADTFRLMRMLPLPAEPMTDALICCAHRFWLFWVIAAPIPHAGCAHWTKRDIGPCYSSMTQTGAYAAGQCSSMSGCC